MSARVRAWLVVLAVLVLMVWAATNVAHADPIGPDCGAGSCFGNIFTLEYKDLTPTERLFLITIDTTSHTLPSNYWIDQVAFKVTSNSADISLASLLLTTPGSGAWTQPQIGGLNSGGCFTGNAGFVCISSSDELALLDGSTYQFLFDISLATGGSWLAGLGSMKANYDGPDKPNGLLTSAPIQIQQNVDINPQCLPGTCTNAVPEPGTVALLGVGLLALGVARVRRRRWRS